MLRASAARKSLPPCRRCLLGAAGLLLAAAIAIAPGAGRAQAPDADSGTTLPDTNKDLLEPKLQGSPKALPRFRRPGERTPARGDQAPPPGKFTAASRIGAIPLYGSPPASGAGVPASIRRTKNAARTPRKLQRRRAGERPRRPAERSSQSRRQPSRRYRHTRSPCRPNPQRRESPRRRKFTPSRQRRGPARLCRHPMSRRRSAIRRPRCIL